MTKAGSSEERLAGVLDRYTSVLGRPCSFCPADPRFVAEGDRVRLASRELTEKPRIDGEVAKSDKYATHLPVHSLAAAAASLPAGEWGEAAAQEAIETLGWLRVALSDRRLNERMFVARIEGHSMDDGRTGLQDGAYAVFELWPAGTRQNLNVLVRGSFTDPETGSYALKKYDADQRDDEGRHHSIRLVSLNPDKDRYPDIQLDEDDADAVTVVAKLVRPLAPGDYARVPKRPGRKGRRDIRSPSALQAIGDRLVEMTDRFFELPAEDAATEPSERARAGWNSQIVCLDAAAGGVHLEIGPLQGLWKFVEVLVARTATGDERRVLASNARLRSVRVPVSPSSGAWTWTAEGFEDDADIDLAGLDSAGLPYQRVSVFRVGADGVGRFVAATSGLSVGQRYRIVLPEGLIEEDEPPLPAEDLADGWSLVELDLSEGVSPTMRVLLGRLGLAVGSPSPSLSFATPSWPDEWRWTSRGDTYASFAVDENGTASVWIQVRGYEAELEGEARLFVRGPDGTNVVDLPEGEEALVEIEDLVPGQYVCSVVHQRTSVGIERLPFVVSDVPAASPVAGWSIEIGQTLASSRPGEEVEAWRGNLERLAAEDVSIDGPPGLPVAVSWRELAPKYLGTVWLDALGHLSGDALLDLVSETSRRRSVGDLLLHFGEFGLVVLLHERRATLTDVRDALAALAGQRGDAVDRRRGAYAQLLPLWFEPVCRVLGFDVEEMDQDALQDPPVHATVARLVVTERRSDSIGRVCKRVLVMLDYLDDEVSGEMREWLDSVLLAEGVDDALLSTGLEWATHRRRSRLPLKRWNVNDVLLNEDSFVEFLRDVAEGI